MDEISPEQYLASLNEVDRKIKDLNKSLNSIKGIKCVGEQVIPTSCIEEVQENLLWIVSMANAEQEKLKTRLGE